MKLFILSSLVCISCMVLFSCSTKNSSESDSKKIKELEVRLIATESQLLNIKSELAKCSDLQDSVKVIVSDLKKDSLNKN